MEHLVEWDLTGKDEAHILVLHHPLQPKWMNAYIIKQSSELLGQIVQYILSCTAVTKCLYIGWYVANITYLVWLTCVVRISEEWLNTNGVIFNSILQSSTQVDTLAIVGPTGHLEPYISFWLVMICCQMLKSFFNLISRVKRTKVHY